VGYLPPGEACEVRESLVRVDLVGAVVVDACCQDGGFAGGLAEVGRFS
jgi:hypothetical protein